MHNSIFKISFLAIAALCLLWGPVGCGEEEAPVPAKPAVVATKIKVAAPKPPKAQKPAAPVQKAVPAPVAKKAEKASVPAGGDPAAVKKGDDASIQKTMEDIKKGVATEADTMYRARLYNPEGKLDPFESPFKKTETEKTTEEKPPEDQPDRIRQTPLEKIDLAQLSLVGVIKFSSGYKAIVEEQSGKGYMVTKGTYIGINYGQITAIENDRIIIQEKVKDILGRYKDQKSQLKLQKPLGEN